MRVTGPDRPGGSVSSPYLPNDIHFRLFLYCLLNRFSGAFFDFREILCIPAR
jgi:hypothetical protein